MTTAPATTLTKDSKEAQKNDGKSSHAQPKNLFFLHQFAVVAGESGRADARVALDRVAVDALAAVVARVIEALVAIDAALAVGCHALPSWTSARRRWSWLR